MNFFKRDRTFREPIGKLTTFFMVAFHIGAVAALFMFTWKAFFVALLLWWLAGSLGIGIAYHRLLTHRGFKTYKWFEYFITFCATLALEGGPFFWVATHRVHHQNTDVEGFFCRAAFVVGCRQSWHWHCVSPAAHAPWIQDL